MVFKDLFTNTLFTNTPYHQTFGLSVAGYLTFYLLFQHTSLKRLLIPSRVSKSKEIVWLSYYSSLFHACKSSFSAVAWLVGYTSMFDYHLAIAESVAYAVVDLSVILLHRHQFKNSWQAYLIHHGLMIIVPAYNYYSPTHQEVAMASLIARFYLSEISTIPFDLSWFLIHFEMENSLLCKATKNLTVTSFFFFRIVNFGFLSQTVWYNFQHARIPVFMISSLNLYWFFGMCRNHFFGGNIKRLKD